MRLWRDQAWDAEPPSARFSERRRTCPDKTVTLDSEGAATVRFSITPSKWALLHALSARVWGDSLPGNNSLPAVVRVRDRLRVLQVCETPSLMRSSASLLKRDPSVDLVSFFILRTYEDGLEITRERTPHRVSLSNLFTTDLWSFDLIVLQDFDHQPYFRWDSNALLQNIADYVKREGLVMIGGTGLSIWGSTAALHWKVLPVKLGVRGRSVSEGSFQPQLTAQGRILPSLGFSDPRGKSGSWEAIPA